MEWNKAPSREDLPAGGQAAVPDLRQLSGDRTFTLVSGTGRFVDWKGRTPASRETEIVALNEDLLSSVPVLKKGDLLEMQFLGREPVSTEVTSVETRSNGTVAIGADLLQDDHGRMYLSYTDGQASILLEDTRNLTTYKIQYSPEFQAYLALDVDYLNSDILGCGGGQCDLPEHEHDAIKYEDTSIPTPAGDVVEGSPLPDIVTLDVLAVYTPAALASEGSEASMLNNISIAFQKANDAHQNSDTRVILNLVHSSEVDYSEESPETSSSPNLYLNDLTDGNIPGVHTLRDTYSADFVVFFVSTQMTGGLAWRPSSYNRPDLGFSLVRVQQTDFTFTMVHEVGHNMGLGHSATQATQAYSGDFYSYAAGWQWTDPSSPASIGFCSVMTYENFDGVSGNEYIRVAHFSNPDVSYNGNPTGDTVSGNAALVIRNGRFEYSGYRGTKAVPAAAYTAFPASVDFEDYLEFWYQTDTDDLEWDTRKTPTPSPNTGPSAAFDGIYYMYLEASSPVAPGEEAVLLANLDFSGYEAASIDFAYHMYGPSMGSLYLEASTDGGGVWSELWSRSGDQGTSWLTESVDLSSYDDQAVRLRFRAVRGSGFQSDISLDAITIAADPLPTGYSGWVAANYPALADPAEGADPDADGMPNFVEYALGRQLDFAESGSGTSLLHDDVAGTYEISFLRGQETVHYVVESSLLLDDWSLATEEWDSSLVPADLVPVGQVQTVSVPVPAGEDALFVRLKVVE